MQIDTNVKPADLLPHIDEVFRLAAIKVRNIDQSWDSAKGTPVFTVGGSYDSRGWTEWTQGFQYGCAILCYDGMGDTELLELGRKRTLENMAHHVTHVGVHDHGFNNLSTYGNLRRLMREGKTPHDPWENHFYEMALKASAAVQAARWAWTEDGLGYVYSFNGPHSLFIDTMRTLRIMSLGDQLCHVLMGEHDERISLLKRTCQHALASAKHLIWYGQGRDHYDVRGRTAHEAIFNRNDGRYRCPSTQQGYSPFSTWTRGQAWAICGYPEELEFFATLPEETFAKLDIPGYPTKASIVQAFEQAAAATCDFFIEQGTSSDGVTYWDCGAPNLHKLGDWQNRPADPYNDHEPVDTSAAAIAAQGLIRFGRYLGSARGGDQYIQAGLTSARTLMQRPHLATDEKHQGLLLHSIYHRPNGWDFIHESHGVPNNESCMWGDYHLLELALLIQRLAKNEAYPTFFDQ